MTADDVRIIQSVLTGRDERRIEIELAPNVLLGAVGVENDHDAARCADWSLNWQNVACLLGEPS